MRFRNKSDWIKPFIRDKKVLDLGCVQHNMGETKKLLWLHRIIREHARSVLGVDYLQTEVIELKGQGYNVICANVETMELQDEFEVIVAGDIIEHLSNLGEFMKRIHNHLAPGGLFLLTTPNPVNLLRFIDLFIEGEVRAHQEHTCWITKKNLNQLAERYDFEIIEEAYVDDSYQYYRFKWLPFLYINYVLCLVRPQFCETLCFVLKRNN